MNVDFASLKEWFINELSIVYDKREAVSILKILLKKLDSKNRNWIFLKDDAVFLNSAKNKIEQLFLSRLLTNEPLDYILGETEFYDTILKVNSTVLIPRPETEELVNWILSENNKNLNILDIGCGSGCIAIALAKSRENWQVEAIDMSKAAIDLAKENADFNAVAIDFYLLDILQDDLPKQYDIIVSNPPYITKTEKDKMSYSTVKYEPELALFVENDDPLLFYRRIGALAKKSLSKNGKLYFELNEFYSEETKSILESLGFEVTLKQDLQGKWRMARCVL